MDNKTISFIDGDITYEEMMYIINGCQYIGIDTETTGLDPLKDELCIIQISANDKVLIIKYNKENIPVNIVNVLSDKNICKVFHHANFDIRFMMKNFKTIEINNVVCTKIAAKLLYGTSSKNSLKELLDKILNIKIDKEQQTSDWTKKQLTNEQIAYASNDVKYLVDLWLELEEKLKNNGLLQLALNCYNFLPVFSHLQNIGIENIFTY
ncbi:ribonuclease D [Tissierella praeacuta]|uniref:ribonuclease D n=1 Tax=Tissierella praeacuta TaxID=43131 RepID=UPI0028A9A606|nr:ribonuclease D [Tissierella praeacuta]